MRAILAIIATVGVAGSAVAQEAPTQRSTDFGIRTVDGGRMTDSNLKIVTPMRDAAFEIDGAVSIARQYGRVTSTFRSPAHNRRVGGARNSYHLRNRAIDVVLRPGVSHRQVDRAFRAAGFRLVESLNEGDHSHFAFGNGFAIDPDPTETRPAVQMVTTGPRPTDFRIVTVGASN
ncbi:MAG: hypothetical protein HKO13_03715 [Sphingomonas sp.]|nr:hypothetical protein [Sphingomonas sp.]